MVVVNCVASSCKDSDNLVAWAADILFDDIEKSRRIMSVVHKMEQRKERYKNIQFVKDVVFLIVSSGCLGILVGR